MTQAFVTVVVPFLAGREARVNAYLDTLGNVAGCGRSAKPPRNETLSSDQLKRLGGFIHFMSMVVVPEDGGRSAFLVIEICADGQPGEALERVVQTIPDALRTVIGETGNDAPGTDQELGAYLKAHRVEVGTGIMSRTLGLVFAGTPDMTVSRIRDEARLAAKIRDLLDQNKTANSALARLEHVRNSIFGDVDLKWAFVSEPVRLLDDAQPMLDLVGSLLRAAVRDFFWPLILLPLLVGIWSLWMCNLPDWVALIFKHSRICNPIDSVAWDAILTLGIELVIAGLAFWFGYKALRRQEKDDVPFDHEPEMERVKQIMDRENQPGVAQNHVCGVSIVKPGRVRRVSLRIGLWIIAELARGRSRPGYLDKIGTIHFARWLLLPGTDRLLFLSNYDGSWQSYLEDFIARLREGLSSVWSNTRDFPRTANLVAGGAEDGARFKRWARRQQQPTRFWYSAYPELTTSRIRINAAIRHGFASVSSESDAAKWLALFGYSAPENVEKEDMSALVLSGLPGFPFAHCLILKFAGARAPREWLRSVKDDLLYGEHAQLLERGLVVAFTSCGLRKLGLDETALATFPTAYQQGMAAPERARALGDMKRGDWWWGKAGDVDAALILYAKSDRDLRTQTLKCRLRLREDVQWEVRLRDLGNSSEEPFGFKDGISQPIMRGSKHWSEPQYAMHVVEPGELVLGYRDNLGNLSPSPTSKGQDIGRSGTFLVIRQLEQDKAAFDEYVANEAVLLATNPCAPRFGYDDLKHWVAARMVGRWRDGSSLVRYSHPPHVSKWGIASRPSDNEFSFGREDPDGLRCPLGAHIRRANPRDSFEPGSPVQLAITNRHRILRVGRVYEPEKGKKRSPGLLFMCVNADIERQFEFIQQTWLLGPNFHGLEDEIDPIVGYRSNKDAMTVPTPQGPVHLKGLAKFVTTRGGGYFFIPGRNAIRVLAG